MTNGDGSIDNPFNNFQDALSILDEDPSTNFASLVLYPGTYISTAENNILISGNYSDVNLHLKSKSGDYADTIITTDQTDFNANWRISSDKKLWLDGITFSDIMPADNAVNEQIIVDTSADDSHCFKNFKFKFYSIIRNLSTRPFIRALNGKIIIEDSFFDNNICYFNIS